MTRDLTFKRGNKIPEVGICRSKCELFSICRKLIDHYSIAGCLRATCSYIKRRAEEVNWEDEVDDKTVTGMREIAKEVRQQDPV